MMEARNIVRLHPSMFVYKAYKKNLVQNIYQAGKIFENQDQWYESYG